MIQELPQERWPELADVFREKFDAVLPDPSAIILADVAEDGSIGGFMVLEFLARIGQIHDPGDNARGMFQRLIDTIPREQSVVAFTTKPVHDALCERYGFYEVEGKIYRRDF